MALTLPSGPIISPNCSRIFLIKLSPDEAVIVPVSFLVQVQLPSRLYSRHQMRVATSFSRLRSLSGGEESAAQRDSAGDAHSESESAAACHFEDGRQCLDRQIKVR